MRSDLVRPDTLKRIPRAALPLCLFASGTLVLYWKALGVPFLFDDIIIVGKPWFVSFADPLVFLVYNRPMVGLSYALNHVVGGPGPAGYHLFQVLLHGVNAFLLFLLVPRLLRFLGPGTLSERSRRWAGIAAGSVYAAHPLLSMAVVLVSARSELMGAFFYLVGLLFYLRLQEHPSRLGWALLALVYLCAATSKEIAITFPAACLMIQAAAGKNPLAALRREWKTYSALALVSAGLVVKVLGFAWGETVGGASLPFTRWEYAMTQVWLLARYVGVAALPLPRWLCSDWDTPVVRSIWDAHFLLSACFWALFAASLLWAWRAGRRSIAWCGAMYVVANAPTCSVIPIADPQMEYRIYLPAAFLVAMLAVGAADFWAGPVGRRLRSALSIKWAVAGVGVAVAVLGVMLSARLGAYRTSESFWQDAISKAPKKIRPRYNLMHSYLGEGRLDEALSAGERLLKIDPRHTDTLAAVGDIYREKGDLRAAEEHYIESFAINPRQSSIANRVANLLIRVGRYDEAADILAQVPDKFKDEGYHLNVAVYLAQTGKLKEAEGLYGYLTDRYPDFGIAWVNRGSLLDRMNRLREAESCYLMALSLQPNQYLGHFGLGVLYLRMGRPADALGELEKARSLNPWFADTEFQVANVLAATRRYGEARPHYGRYLKMRPLSVEGWYRLGLVEMETGCQEQANGCFRKVIDLAKGSPVAVDAARLIK